MNAAGLFTNSDLHTIGKAASLAETLTHGYFDLTEDWTRRPYHVLTRRHVNRSLHVDSAFAQVVKLTRPAGKGGRDRYGVVLQDPNILAALLRTTGHDLWTLALFTLTHELVHIVRFESFGVDFFAGTQERDAEERVVHGITGEILRGACNTDYLLELYGTHI